MAGRAAHVAGAALPRHGRVLDLHHGMASLLRLTGVIAALMKVYAPVALVLLTVTAICATSRAWPRSGSRACGVGSHRAGPRGKLGDPALHRLLRDGRALERGLGCRVGPPTRCLVGGLAGIVLAGSWTAVMSLLVVAGAAGRLRWSIRRAATAAAPPPLSFRWGVVHGVGGDPAAVILILFGLAALAPACYSSFVFLRSSSRTGRRYAGSTGRGSAARWPSSSIATTWSGRLEAIDYSWACSSHRPSARWSGTTCTSVAGGRGPAGPQPARSHRLGVGRGDPAVLDDLAARGSPAAAIADVLADCRLPGCGPGLLAARPGRAGTAGDPDGDLSRPGRARSPRSSRRNRAPPDPNHRQVTLSRGMMRNAVSPMRDGDA